MNAKKFSSALFVAFLLAFAASSGAEAIQEVVILEVTGILEALEKSTFVLSIEGQKTDPIPYTRACEFVDSKGKPIGKDTFARQYLKKKITVEFYEHNAEIVFCRPAR
ncbi:MAG: hypothetical protein LBD04_12295 [Synergistaceae bacterium]|nr:hypothetical protein [Synergistaceae bacterium]